MTVASGLVFILWGLSVVAISGGWRSEVPTVHLVQMRLPVHAVVVPIAWIPLSKHDGIAVVSHKRQSARSGIVKRAGVQLTKNQAGFVSRLGQYLKSMGEYAIVTSGARSPDHQLSIIKQKIRAIGASRIFPQLRHATVSRSNTWLAAWEYLRARHVPVNAPASAGGEAAASNHIKGLAVDLISGSLDHLRSLILGFAHSSFASRAPLAVASIAREPGCVHINLMPRS
ncbi:MAG TPA: hypothetical protein VG537_01155 [Candidatus Kapabacteria bacterium]|jgi:hypothetical protein|nr:hypothetical protein [Candidatus Kapabacteria bacterium]